MCFCGGKLSETPVLVGRPKSIKCDKFTWMGAGFGVYEGVLVVLWWGCLDLKTEISNL